MTYSFIQSKCKSFYDENYGFRFHDQKKLPEALKLVFQMLSIDRELNENDIDFIHNTAMLFNDNINKKLEDFYTKNPMVDIKKIKKTAAQYDVKQIIKKALIEANLRPEDLKLLSEKVKKNIKNENINDFFKILCNYFSYLDLKPRENKKYTKTDIENISNRLFKDSITKPIQQTPILKPQQSFISPRSVAIIKVKQTTNKNSQSSLYERSIENNKKIEERYQNEIDLRRKEASQKHTSKGSKDLLLKKFFGANDDLIRRNPQIRKHQ